jgi:chorismate mutase
VVNGLTTNNGDDDGDDVHLTTSQVLSLDSIRASLIRQEETIIFALIERAQFRHNPVVYEKGGLGHLGTPPGSKKAEEEHDELNAREELSFLEYMLIGTEALHCAVRRYTSPQEHAFFPSRLPFDKVLEELEYPSLLDDKAASAVNFNEILLKKYIEDVVPAICQPGDDEQHGSTALCDVAVLQALSKRVHYGKFVAESKYLADPEGYQRLVDANDAEGVMRLLTNEVVEAKVLRRARLKAATYGTEPLLADLPPFERTTTQREMTCIVAAAAASAVVAAIEAMGDDGSEQIMNNKVCPSTVESIYRDLIIPLTKDIEVAYLFRRCGKEPPPEYSPNRMSTDPQ